MKKPSLRRFVLSSDRHSSILSLLFCFLALPVMTASAVTPSYINGSQVNLLNAWNASLTVTGTQGNSSMPVANARFAIDSYSGPNGLEFYTSSHPVATLDFGAVRNFKTLTTWDPFGSYDFTAATVETSTDGTNWTTQVNSVSSPSATTVVTLASAVNARYVRLTPTTFEQPSDRWIFYTMRAFGDSTAVAADTNLTIIANGGFSASQSLTAIGSIAQMSTAQMLAPATYPLNRPLLYLMSNGEGFKLDLGQTFRVDRGTINLANITASPSTPMTMTVSGSTDGTTFTTLYTKTYTSNVTTFDLFNFCFTPTNARYLKVLFSSSGSIDVAVSDFAFFQNPALDLTGAAIGSAVVGTQSYDPVTGYYTVTGSGTGITLNATTDNIYFDHTTATGDMEFVARLVSVTGPSECQAGLMIRKSNDPNEAVRASSFYWQGFTWSGWPAGGTNLLSTLAGGPSVAGNDYYYYISALLTRPTMPLPCWFKLVRIGQNYGAYWSLDNREWVLISNASGGSLIGTGSFNVGLFVGAPHSTATQTTAAVFDNVYLGAPRMKYKTSWLGDTSGGLADGHASSNICALWVKPDGTCYGNAQWMEGGQSVKAYKDGKVAFYLPVCSNSGLFEGTITGNANNLFVATNNPGPAVYRTDFNGKPDFNGNDAVAVSFTTPLGKVGGLAASDTLLFVSDTTNNNVRIVNLALPTPAEISTSPILAGVIAHPGPIAYDLANNCFWITDCGSPFPLSSYVTAQSGYTPKIKCVSPAGSDLGRDISGISNPTALVKHPTLDRLYVCDNGANQNIRYYTGLGGTPALGGTFGQTGGLWPTGTGTHPGQIYDSAFGGDQRFYGPTGVGFDGSGNIYVACNGTNGAGTDLRKFDHTTGAMVWRQLGLEGVNAADFDPGTDGREVYTTDERFTMNYANLAPGTEWSYTAFTRNPFQAGDPRNDPITGGTSRGVQIRRLAGGNVFMYTNGMGSAPPCLFYRFNNQDGASGAQGTTATPYGSILNSTGGFALWIDTNGNGVEEPLTEDITIPCNLGDYWSYDVDSQGNIWLALGSLGYNTSIAKLPCAGSMPIPAPPATQVATVPAYNAAGFQTFRCPLPITVLQSIKYDYANDVMYCLGTTVDHKWVLARFDNWRTSPTPDDHQARYVVPLPDQTADVTTLAYPGTNPSYNIYMGMGFAGDKLFIADLWGPIRVYDATMGNLVITLNPGPEVSATTAWEDMKMGINAFKRSTGEYLVSEEDDGWAGNILLYRWTPTPDTTAPGTATNLTATAQGHAIALSWTGPAGTVTSYNIYRGTSSGSLTLYQSNVTGSSFVDTNVTFGTTYYYTVAAVTTVGTGAQSNQASATPAGSQAEFVKYDTTTRGTWWPATGKVYGVDGQCIARPSPTPIQYVNPAPYVDLLTPVYTSPRTYSVPPTDTAGLLQKGSDLTDRALDYWINDISDPDPKNAYQQLYKIKFGTTDAGWHQVSLYMLSDYGTHVMYDTVDVLEGDGTSGVVLDSRQPMDYVAGKWLVWNVRGNVTIRVTRSVGWSYVSGIFFDPVKAPAPTVGWWKLDDASGTVATDSSGAGNNLTWSGTGNTWNASGHIAGCLNLTGAGSATLPAGLLGTLGDRTFCTWIYKTANSGAILGEQALPNFAPILYFGTDGKLYGSYNTGTITPMVSPASVSNNAWHHVALTRAGNVQSMYLDGVLVGTMVAPIAADYSAAQLGSAYTSGWPNITGSPAYFSGKLDDARLYNRALSSSEIWKLSGP